MKHKTRVIKRTEKNIGYIKIYPSDSLVSKDLQENPMQVADED